MKTEKELRKAMIAAFDAYMKQPATKDEPTNIHDRPLFQAYRDARQALIDAGFKP